MSAMERGSGPRIGLGAAYGIGPAGVLRAFDRGVRFFLWGALPKAGFGAGLRTLLRRGRRQPGCDAEVEIAVQSYARRGWAIRPGVELALLRLGTDALDWLCLANWDARPQEEIFEAAARLKERGLVRRILISCHRRTAFRDFPPPPQCDGWMVRYNAAHTRAEAEVFPFADKSATATGGARPKVIAYTALRWGTLLDQRYVPPGETPLSAVEAYRFVLSSQAVDLCLAGPRDETELEAALLAMELGPLDAEGLLRARRIGAAVYAHGRAQPPPRLGDFVKAGPALVRSLLRDGITEHLLSRFNR